MKLNFGYHSKPSTALFRIFRSVALSVTLDAVRLRPRRLRLRSVRADSTLRISKDALSKSFSGGTPDETNIVLYKSEKPPPPPVIQSTPNPSTLMPGSKPDTKK